MMMQCDKCPVASKCEDEKENQINALVPKFREQIKDVLKAICPLEMVVEMNVSVIGIEFGRYLATKRRFEEKKGS